VHVATPLSLQFFRAPYGNIPTGNPLTGASNAGCMKKSLFFANISLYLGNDTR